MKEYIFCDREVNMSFSDGLSSLDWNTGFFKWQKFTVIQIHIFILCGKITDHSILENIYIYIYFHSDLQQEKLEVSE